MSTILTFSYVSYCIVYLKNSSKDVPKPTPGCSTVYRWIQDPSWITKNLKDKKSWKISVLKDYLKHAKTNCHYLWLQKAIYISEVSTVISRGRRMNTI